MHLRGPMNVSQIAVYKLPGMSISKRAATGQSTSGRNGRSRYIHRVDDSLGNEAIGLNSSPKHNGKRWDKPPSSTNCLPRSTVTTTVYVRGSMCQPGSASSIAQQPPVVVTTTVTDTETVCERSRTSSSPWPTSESPANSTYHGPSCPCWSTFETRVSSANSTTTSTSISSFDTPGAVKRSEQRSVLSDAPSPIKTPTPTSYSDPDVIAAAASTWSRVAYYTSAAPAAASGFAFLANLGDPQRSGTFD